MDQESFDHSMPEILMPESRRRHRNSSFVEVLSTNLRIQHLMEVLLTPLAANRSLANARVQMLSLVYRHRRRMGPFVVINDRNMDSNHWA